MSDSHNQYLDWEKDAIELLLRTRRGHLAAAEPDVIAARFAFRAAETRYKEVMQSVSAMEADIAEMEEALEHFRALAQLTEDAAFLAATQDPIAEGLATVLAVVLDTPAAVEMLLDLMEDSPTRGRDAGTRISIRKKGEFNLQIVLTWRRKYYLLYRNAHDAEKIQALYRNFRASAAGLDDRVVAIEVDVNDLPHASRRVALVYSDKQVSVERFPFTIGDFGETIINHLLHGSITIGRLPISR